MWQNNRVEKEVSGLIQLLTDCHVMWTEVLWFHLFKLEKIQLAPILNKNVYIIIIIIKTNEWQITKHSA